MVDNSALIQQSPSSFETELAAPEFMQNGTDAPQSRPLYEQNSHMEGESQAIHTFGTSPEAPGVVPHWSQYADPLADPSTPLCKFFVQSRCHQGDACDFRHSITVNEYALLFRDPQPPLWSSRAQLQLAEHAIPAAVSAFGVCKFYPLGRCRNGDRCPYLHTPPPTSMLTASTPKEGWADHSESTMPSYRNQRVRLCRYYAENGYCNRGEDCRFSHEIDDQNDQNDGRTEWQDNDNKAYVAQRNRPCKYFSEGCCKKGDKCIFLHDNANSEQKHGDNWEMASNGWGATVDAWDAPNANDWDTPNADGWNEHQVDNWGEPIMNSPAKQDGSSEGGTSMGGVSLAEPFESPHSVTSETDKDCHDTVRIETPPKDSWDDQTETPWDDSVPEDHSRAAMLARSRDDSSMGQANEPRNDMPPSNIHKWALTVADEFNAVESQYPDDDDEKTWSTPWSDNVAEFNTPIRIHAPCKAFGQGYCFKGDACQYQHIAPPDPMMESQKVTREVSSQGDFDVFY